MTEPWYQDGLRFECTRCGHCCTGAPGYVWVNDEELAAIAEHRNEPVDELRQWATRPGPRGLTLKEKPNGDCVFYDRDVGCKVYPVRPRQCRTWPFWESNLRSPETWARAASGCPGCNQGELVPVEEITRRLKVIRI